MNKNILTVLLIFLVPLIVYHGLTKKELSSLPAIAAYEYKVFISYVL